MGLQVAALPTIWNLPPQNPNFTGRAAQLAALAAGLIHGTLDGDLGKGVEYGGALGAIKHTIPGDLPWVTKDEVEAVLGGQGLRIRR